MKPCTQCGKEGSRKICEFRHIRPVGVVLPIPACRMPQQRRKVEEDRMADQQDAFESEQMANALKAMGVRKGDVVTIYLPAFRRFSSRCWLAPRSVRCTR